MNKRSKTILNKRSVRSQTTIMKCLKREKLQCAFYSIGTKLCYLIQFATTKQEESSRNLMVFKYILKLHMMTLTIAVSISSSMFSAGFFVWETLGSFVEGNRIRWLWDYQAAPGNLAALMNAGSNATFFFRTTFSDECIKGSWYGRVNASRLAANHLFWLLIEEISNSSMTHVSSCIWRPMISCNSLLFCSLYYPSIQYFYPPGQKINIPNEAIVLCTYYDVMICN